MTIGRRAISSAAAASVSPRCGVRRTTSGLSEVSMGMTDDLEVAVEAGATMVRIGRALFGPRAATVSGCHNRVLRGGSRWNRS